MSKIRLGSSLILGSFIVYFNSLDTSNFGVAFANTGFALVSTDSLEQMAKLHTHYDNLKVARTAPPEVIRAAYRALSQQYHPDHYKGDKNASRIMAIINTSYEVLSDPGKRRAHDDWIARQEANAKQKTNAPNPQPEEPRSQKPEPPPRPQQRPSQPFRSQRSFLFHFSRYGILLIVAGLIIWGAVSDPPPPPPGPKPYNPTPKVQEDLKQPKYVKPISAPNGVLWPQKADYVSGYDQLNTDGLSSLTVDNAQNDSDVFVKLVSLNGTEAYPARQFYIPAFGKFTVKKVTAGSYDIRYRDLETGELSRSESFSLEEKNSLNGTQYSVFTVTLYKVLNGNMKTFPLAESEF